MNIHLKIKECIDKKGTDIIVTNTLIGMLDDEQVFEDIESAPYKKILRNIIKEGYAQKLLDLGSYTSDVSFLASQYAQANLMQEGPILYVLDCLAYGLGWINKEPTLQVAPSQGNTQTPAAPTSEPQQKKGFFNRLFSFFGSSQTSSPSPKKPSKPRKPQKTGDEYYKDALAADKNGDINAYFDNLKKAANKGVGDACWRLGCEYNYGGKVVVDHETAAKWYSKGASKGNEKCLLAMGFVYIKGEGVEKDLDKAMSYFKKLTKDGMGDDNAMYGMGYCYFEKLNEYGVNATVESVKCFDDAERWLLAAAQRNNVQAQFWLGQLYLQYGHIHVRVIDYDDIHKKAYEWFRKAADQGHETAKEQLWKFRGYWPRKRI